MKLSLAKPALLLAALLAVSTSTGCGVINSIRAKNQLTEGARAYKAGHFDRAQEHFQRSLALNPEQKNARFFIARSIHAQYRPGVEDPKNQQKAREAIAAYQEVLKNNPDNDEAYNAILYLHNQLKEEDKVNELLNQRAQTGADDKRAQALTVLASKQWNCSYTITEQRENKATVMKENRAIIQYKKPKEQADLDKAKQCVAQGLELANRALSLDPNSEQAWSYKTNLLLEQVKLAEMEGNADQRAEFQRQADAAQQRTSQLSEENKRKKEAEEKAKRDKEQAAS